MIVQSLYITLYAPWVHSLKDKRTVVKGLCAKAKNRFNVSIAEVDEQDTHQTIVLGVACVATTMLLSDGILDSVIRFVEGNTQAEITNLEREVR